jgi:hypothetical protein
VATFRCDITPPMGQPLAGGDAIKIVEQPLLAKGIVLDVPEGRYVLCALDWCLLFGDSYRSLQGKIATAAGVDPSHVAVQCVHQHTAPAVGMSEETQGPKPVSNPAIPKFDPKAFDAIADRIAASVKESLGRFEPFDRIGSGQAKVDRVASCRRVWDAQGKACTRWSHCKDLAVRNLPEGTIDPYLKTITLARGDKPLVRLHYYATHPQTRYRDNRVSSDMVGDAREALEKKEGAFQIYFNGCGGDITLGKYNDATDQNRKELAGRLLAGMEAAVAATKLTPVQPVRWRTYALDLPWKPEPNAPKDAKKHQPIELTSLEIGDIRIVHLPGEPMLCFQQFAQGLKPAAFTAVAGYGDGEPGYLCPEKAFAEGGYEPIASNVKPEAEAVVKKAIAALLGAEE